jgi:hypothetical protein
VINFHNLKKYRYKFAKFERILKIKLRFTLYRVMRKFWILSFWVVFDFLFILVLTIFFPKFHPNNEIYIEKFGITLLNYITSKNFNSLKFYFTSHLFLFYSTSYILQIGIKLGYHWNKKVCWINQGEWIS